MAIEGNITVTVSGDGSPQAPFTATLSGPDNEVCQVSENGITLTPQTVPAHYHFTFGLDSQVSLTFVGIRIYHDSTEEEPNAEHAKFFIPPSLDEESVELHILHDFESGVHVVYHIGIGINSASGPHWLLPDPTISFEPEQPPGPSTTVSRTARED